jgi:hypothetical protein
LRTLMLLLMAMMVPVPASGQVAQPRSDAYLDEAAREMVRQARIRRAMVDHRIQSYETTAVERISFGLRAGIGERLLYRRETASHIHWTRDTVRIDVRGAREVLPPFSGLPQIPGDLSGYVPALAFDPVDSEMLLRLDSTTIRHPLAPGSEAHYRFASGDSTVIRLPDGRTVRLHELRIQPRRSERHLIAGSFWLEAETHAVVQAYFRLARGYDSSRDRDAGGLAPTLRAELDYIALDYGLWDLRWWLPRTVAAKGMAQISGFRMPLEFERRYDAYTVVGDTVALPTLAEAVRSEPRPCRPPVRFSVQARVGDTPPDTAAVARRAARRDSARLARADADGVATDSAAVAADSARTICDRAFIVTKADNAELFASELLPGTIFAGEPFIDDEQLRRIADRLRAIPGAPWHLEAPVLQWGTGALGLARYNRVEGLSIGARALLGFGGAGADLEVRGGTAGEIGAQLGLEREGAIVRSRLAAYRRLDVADIAAQPFTLGSSLGALLSGRDDHDYFRASGAELTLRPPLVRTQWYELRLFAERQASVARESNFHVPRIFDSERTFRDNLDADAADQLGATLRLQVAGGQNPRLPRWGAELELHGETGDYQFLRPAARLRLSAPLGQRLGAGLELGGGSSFGDTPAQRLWQIGGAPTLRGYEAAAARGEAFWRGRGELATGTPLVRATVFSDVGWAGPRDALRQSRPLQSVGGGLSFLDGLFRVDLARGVQNRQWRLHVQLDGLL